MRGVDARGEHGGPEVCGFGLAATPDPSIPAANETDPGIVPDDAMACASCDHAGRLNQAVAGTAGRVYFVAAGLPVGLKGAG